VVLEGPHVRLEPLAASHVDALCAVGLDPAIWRWMLGPIETRAQMEAWVEAALADRDAGRALPFAILERERATVCGSTRYGNIEAAQGRLEIGWSWVAGPWQRTVVNTEAKYLLLRHAFEELGYRRVELKTDALNLRSREAIRRIGGVEEGTLRRHMVTATGRVRETVYFSILDEEWPAVKARLEEWLAGGPQR
jgi:RimJ/RimL family protein N-acetyltransferase